MIAHSKPYLGPEESEAAARVLASGHLAQGAEVEAFEKECAERFGRRYGVAVSSGTAALHLALGAVGVGTGDSVAVPSYSCAALITAVRLQQADPVLCDVGDDCNLDPRGVPGHCSTVIVPHLFGGPAALPESGVVIEDVAQSLGGPGGCATPVAVASFYVTKLMTTGEGGMLLTDDEGIAEYGRDRRDYDKRENFQVRYPYKMTDLQAAVGRVQLGRLSWFLERRREIAQEYCEALARLPLALPVGDGHVYFRYVVRTERRDGLEAYLNVQGVDAKRPVYRPAHHFLGGMFDGAERAHQECLSLPIYPSMVDADVRRVIDCVVQYME